MVKSHAVLHAIKEGFDRQNMVEAILSGKLIEEYPDDQRSLICGQTVVDDIDIYLHVVCEYADPQFVEIVTAYIPDETMWGWPPFRRRKRK